MVCVRNRTRLRSSQPCEVYLASSTCLGCRNPTFRPFSKVNLILINHDQPLWRLITPSPPRKLNTQVRNICIPSHPSRWPWKFLRWSSKLQDPPTQVHSKRPPFRRAHPELRSSFGSIHRLRNHHRVRTSLGHQGPRNKTIWHLDNGANGDTNCMHPAGLSLVDRACVPSPLESSISHQEAKRTKARAHPGELYVVYDMRRRALLSNSNVPSRLGRTTDKNCMPILLGYLYRPVFARFPLPPGSGLFSNGRACKSLICAFLHPVWLVRGYACTPRTRTRTKGEIA